MRPIAGGYQGAASVDVAEMSLFGTCNTCRGKCCVGRTLVGVQERDAIVARTGRDPFVQWRHNLFYLDRGVCPFLERGRCSVQAIKPFVCQIFPFVPRVVDGELWLYCVGECDAASRLPGGFAEKALTLARNFFKNIPIAVYERYWQENKVGDFDDAQVNLKLRVFENNAEEARG